MLRNLRDRSESEDIPRLVRLACALQPALVAVPAVDSRTLPTLEMLVTLSCLRLGTDTSAARVFKELGPFGSAGPNASWPAIERVATVIGEFTGGRIDRARRMAGEALRRRATLDLGLISIADTCYPERLRQIPDPPIVLWTLGQPAVLEGPTVAVVGSRHATTTGLSVARRLSSELAAAGLTVVSGLARGIDGAAHRGAIDAGGTTIAVLGNGPDVVYPAEHRELRAAVRQAGVIVTEYPPGTRPEPRYFPLRNRIISGLSQAVVVVEASEKSGSLITARAALEQGRDVLAVPGSTLSGCYRRCHALIKDGARLVETVDDILEELGRPRHMTPVGVFGDKGHFHSSLDVVFPRGEPVSVDELALRTGRSAAQWLRELAILELAGAVRRTPGGTFVRLDGPATYIKGQLPEDRKDTGSRHAEGSRRRRIAGQGEDD